MAERAVLIYDEANLAYRFGDDHPFQQRRLALTVDLLERAGLLDRARQVVAPTPADEAELRLAHAADYIAAVRRLSAPGAVCDRDCYGLGTPDVPIFAGMHAAAALSVGGTLLAVRLVMDGDWRHAFHLAGGHHHAQRALASGFCIYNDAVVAIEWLTRERRARVLYIDNDAHHGDGVEAAFAERADVLTISLHESGRTLYPGTGAVEELGRGAGYGYSLNVPLEAGTDDDSWLTLFEAVVPAAALAFRPDLIVLQHGCDGHRLDPLSHLAATTRTFETVIGRVHELAEALCDGRLVVLGGGGYEIWRVVPRAWALSWAVLSGHPAPDLVPADWRARWQAESPLPLPTELSDASEEAPPQPRRAAAAVNATTLRRLRRLSPFLARAEVAASVPEADRPGGC